MLTRAERAAIRARYQRIPATQEDITAELHSWLYFRQRMTDSKIVHLLSHRAWYTYNTVSDIIVLLQKMSKRLTELHKVSMALETYAFECLRLGSFSGRCSGFPTSSFRRPTSSHTIEALPVQHWDIAARRCI